MRIFSVLILLIIIGCSEQINSVNENVSTNQKKDNKESTEKVIVGVGLIIATYPSIANQFLKIEVTIPDLIYIDLSIRILYGENLKWLFGNLVSSGIHSFQVDISNLSNGLYVAYLQTSFTTKKSYFLVQH